MNAEHISLCPSSPDQPERAAAPASRRDEAGGTARDLVVMLSRLHSDAIAQHGARIAVMSELLATILGQLPPSTRTGIEQAFRGRVENLMSATDDHYLPVLFHNAMLDEANFYLKALKR